MIDGTGNNHITSDDGYMHGVKTGRVSNHMFGGTAHKRSTVKHMLDGKTVGRRPSFLLVPSNIRANIFKGTVA